MTFHDNCPPTEVVLCLTCGSLMHNRFNIMKRVDVSEVMWSRVHICPDCSLYVVQLHRFGTVSDVASIRARPEGYKYQSRASLNFLELEFEIREECYNRDC